LMISRLQHAAGLIINASLGQDLFAPKFKDVLACKVTKECPVKDYSKSVSCLNESSPH